MADFDITDPEVRPFTELVDKLADNTVGRITAADVRSIVKSAIPRYLYCAVQNYPATGGLAWGSGASAAGGIDFNSAADFRVVSNGFGLLDDGTGVVYLGKVPMRVNLAVNMAMTCDYQENDVYTTVVQMSLTHTNAFDQIEEPLFTLYVGAGNSPATPYFGQASFTVNTGSKILFQRSVPSGTVDGSLSDSNLKLVQFSLNIEGAMLAPAEDEVRRGVYGSVASLGSLFSTPPFDELHRTTTSTGATTVPNGSYGFAVPATLDPGGVYTPTALNLLQVTNGSWLAIGKLFVGTIKPDNSVGNNTDFYAYGLPTDTEVQVYGPKAAGAWPVYPRAIPIKPPVT